MSRKIKLTPIKVFAATLVVGGLGLGLWWWLASSPSPDSRATRPPVSSARTPVRASANATTPVSTASMPETTAQRSPVPPVQAPSVQAAAPSAGNLGILTGMQATKQELKLRSEIKELEDKLSKTTVMASPSIPPAMSLESTLALPPAGKTPATRSAETRVVAIQGVNGGPLTATVRTSSGTLRTVRQGDRLEGGTVDISKNGVVVRSRGATRTLGWE